MESGMAKACFLSRRVRRAIVATVPPSLGATLSSPPLPGHYSSALRYRSHETERRVAFRRLLSRYHAARRND